jgi:hypothetical protein
MLESRQLFVLAGAVVEGDIKAGMTVVVPLNSAISISERIHSVEFARRADGGDDDVCLCIAYDDREAAQILEDLGIEDETLDVLPADAESV